MAWLTDPRKWDDDWWGGLSYGARMVWDACLTGPFRTVLPGLCRNVSVLTLHDVCTSKIKHEHLRPTVEQTEEAVLEALQPDDLGKTHFYLDRSARVARIPMAPAYNHADNPNVLTSWYRHWRDVPDCDLKFQHIESLRLGVNFAYRDKHGRAVMADKWAATFGQPEQAFRDGGRRLKTYVDLRERWVPSGTVTGTVPPTVTGTVQETLPGIFPSGSGIKDQDQGSGSGIKTVTVTVPETVSPPPHSFVSTQNQIEQTASSNGGVDHGASGTGTERDGVAGGAGGGAGVAAVGGGNGRWPSGLGPAEISASRRRVPRGVE